MIQKNLPKQIRNLCLVLGDQLWLQNRALDGFDPAHDAVLMIEAGGEATAVWSHKQRIAVFLSAMRHFCNEVHAQGMPYAYIALDDNTAPAALGDRLTQALRQLKPQGLHVCEAGEYRVQALVEAACESTSTPCVWLPDTHFMCSKARFAAWAQGRKDLRMEFFYRDMRREHGVLMEGAGRVTKPVGGQWNFDHDNRSAYPKTGPGDITPPAWFAPDRITQDVIALVEKTFPKHPGSTADFGWAVTREHALVALDTFINTRLAHFGPTQDAMWTNTPFGWHSILSVALNLHLLDPREVIAAAEQAHHERGLDLAGVEGFIRQIIGWREFIRGVYWLYPELRQDNHYGHKRPLPAWYWTGQTHMVCMKDAIDQTLRYAYAHHIQRLMVTGLFGLLAEIEPQQVEDWYLAVYADAVEWVELPNVAGMTLYANGGKFTSKPYIASGAYIQRQSNYCKGCRYDPAEKLGDKACPFTTLYWAFLDKHEQELLANPRTGLMAKNIGRLSAEQRAAIRAEATRMRDSLDSL